MSDAADWSRVREVFSRALELDPPRRAAFVRDACGDDSLLHAEVSSLLAAHADAGSLAEGSPFRALDASAVSSLFSGLRSGDRVGPYDIVGPLGAGGMGEVYEARDTLLGRRVAIKILSAELALDASARDRLIREAKALAALNHPNIAAIYGVESTAASDGSGNQATALVLELVEGQTLAERVARGPLSVTDALLVGAQIAGALEAAHEKGIIHRDLKPANIKVTPASTVKVLDFGLAKALDPDRSADAVTSVATRAGTILGTPAYMSPEQVRGADVDKRTDVWAFGCVLFELLTSRRAFGGSTASDCMAAVLEREPNWSALPQATPQSIRVLLRRCLQKDQAKRLRDLGDARFALEDASSTPESAAQTEPGKQRWIALTLLGLTAAALAAVATWIVVQPRRVASPPVVRFEIEPLAPDVLNVSTTTPTLAMSGDGTRLAYSTGISSSGGPFAIRDVGELAPRRVDGVPDGRVPVFSPDGQRIATYDGSRGFALTIVPVAGGAPVRIGIGTTDFALRGMSWASDGTIVYATRDPDTGLLRVSDSGGPPTVITTPDKGKGEADHVYPWVLPAARGILFTILDAATNNPKVAVLDSRDGSQKVLIPGAASAQYYEGGYLVYAVSGTLFARRFDLERLELTGEPVTLANDVMMGRAAGAYFAVSQTGSFAYVPATATASVPRSLVWVDRKGVETSLNVPARSYTSVSLSPDESRIALQINDQQRDVWMWNLRRPSLLRITSSPSVDQSPLWTPNGQRLIFGSSRDGGINLYAHSADGTGTTERLTTTPGSESFIPTAITRDGTRLLGMLGAVGGWHMFVLPLSIPRPADPLVRPLLKATQFVLSPNERFVAFSSDESGRNEIYVRPFPKVNERSWPVSTAGGSHAEWSKDGRELFYLDAEEKLTAVKVDTSGPVFDAAVPVRVLAASYYNGEVPHTYDVSADGTRFLMIKEDPTAPRTGGRIVVVLNAFESLVAGTARR